MTSMRDLTRRTVLQVLAAAALTAVAPRGVWARDGAASTDPLAARLQRLFTNPYSARTVGERYLALAPNEADATTLARLIARTPENYSRLAHADADEMRALLAAQQRRDFANGEIVSVNGWVLSKTEARLCALTALPAASA